MSFDWGLFGQYLFSRYLLEGAFLTVYLAVVSQILGIFLGVLLALANRSHRSPVRAAASFYVWLFRGTPLLLQIIFFYDALPEVGIRLSSMAAAILALSLNEGAYMSEIVRAGIEAIDAGQMEAAKSLGMTTGLAMRRIILPQALRVIIPPTGNEFISMLKNTALVSVISMEELLLRTEQLITVNYRYFEPFAAAAVYYLIMTSIFSIFQGWVERNLAGPRGRVIPRTRGFGR